MKLVVLGSGTAEPHPKRSSAAFWLETSGGTVLLDCSASAPHRMAQEGLDWAGLDAIWVSHFHVDHCGGLSPYLFGMRWAAREAGRTKPLRISGSAGLKDLLSKLNDVDPDKCRVVEMKFLGGMTTDEIAEVTGRATRSIERDWTFARSWLYGQLTTGVET